jgi:D-beta-D-heptose 7-phosphate kinase/D-beta-D-heptose 1-phosphate adenosyltransferase
LLIKSLDELKTIVAALKAQQQRIVFTNGCFDLLHKGHLYLLQEAKKLGTVLILGINSDASVKRLKGKERPIETLERRIENLLQINDINYIVSFEEDTPIQLIEMIQPDILVKGGDYTKENIAGNHIAKQTVIIPLLGNFSTSRKILERKIF